MARGDVFEREANRTVDPETGVEIWQLTSGPTVNSLFYFHVNCFTRDSNTLIIQGLPNYKRGDTPQIFRVDVDGRNLTQLTDAPGIGGVILAKTEPMVYFLRNDVLLRENLFSLEEEVVARIEGVVGPETSLGSLATDDTLYAADVRRNDGGYGILIVDLRTGRAEVKKMKGLTHHVQIDPGDGRRLVFQYFTKSPYRLWILDVDSVTPRPLNVLKETGHFMWMGTSGRVLTTMDYPRRAIVSIAEGEKEPRVIVESEDVYFWHAGVSEDGQWIVSDSNWPDQGIFLIHAPTGRMRKLCNDGSSKTYQLAHPHPAFSPDGKSVVFNSDRYGFPHVFLAKIPGESLKV